MVWTGPPREPSPTVDRDQGPGQQRRRGPATPPSHWGHGSWPGVPEISTLLSLGVIVAILALVTATSLYATRGDGDE